MSAPTRPCPHPEEKQAIVRTPVESGVYCRQCGQRIGDAPAQTRPSPPSLGAETGAVAKILEYELRLFHAESYPVVAQPIEVSFIIQRVIAVFFNNMPLETMAIALDPEAWQNDDAGLWRSAISVERRKKSMRQIDAAIRAARKEILGHD